VALLDIRQVPDPVLHLVCEAVTDFDADLRRLSEDMFETMYAAPGRGLAAPQVGITKRMFVMDETWKAGDPSPMVFVNPVIMSASDTVVTQPEGCLSIPGDLTGVTRPAEVSLRWQNLDGAWHEQSFSGFAAACVQHEADHLDGILITDEGRTT
jgi:peptide deformylase